jgi:hypothetical protein
MATTKTRTASATTPEQSGVTTPTTGAPSADDEAPRPLTSADFAYGSTAVAAPAVEPALHPPGSPAAAAMAVEGIGAWRLDARIGALWTSNNARNAYVWINSVGWRKLAGQSDQAHLGLLQLARLARDTNAVVNYRDEADNMIHEMYIW